MAISTVRVQINGTWHNLTSNGDGTYSATITAPAATSWNQPNKYYDVTVEATNDAGTTTTTNAATLDALKLFVEERIKPVITILSPTSGAYVANAKQPVVFTVTDEAGGSGVDPDTITVKLDGTAVAASTLVKTPVTNGYSVTYTPASALGDGSHTVQVAASDNDGNSADAKSTTFTVDTVPPTLNITAPADGYITNAAALTVRGTTNDITSSPVVIAITLNGTDQGAATVASDGSFSKALTLAPGDNVIVVTATDAAGKVSTVTRNVKYDITRPVVKAASIVPNPVDAGKTMTITVTIVEE